MCFLSSPSTYWGNGNIFGLAGIAARKIVAVKARKRWFRRDIPRSRELMRGLVEAVGGVRV